ncbi:26S proteasome non-ATPase regulatory subunit 11 [Leucoagaricus sp. SymC.cos]|nr:26S proteasome non-ATPase regulatory subunit 11 [Leucoagaricus sp. SymC.cos]
MSSTDLLARTEANPASVEKIYKQILAEDSSTADAQLLRDKETALVKLGELYRDQKGAKSLAGVISLFGNTAWSKAEKRIFFFFFLFFFSTIYNVVRESKSQQFKLALMLIDNLLTELTCLDNKMILTEVHAALTSSQTAANKYAISLFFLVHAYSDLQSRVHDMLSQMILDKVFHGVLDQRRGCLLVFNEPEVNNTYGAAIDTLEQVGKVVQSLYAKVCHCVLPLRLVGC